MDRFDLTLRERLLRLDAAAPIDSPPVLGTPTPLGTPRTRTRIGRTLAQPQGHRLAAAALATILVASIGGVMILDGESRSPGSGAHPAPRNSHTIDWDVARDGYPGVYKSTAWLTADSLRIDTPEGSFRYDVTPARYHSVADVSYVLAPGSQGEAIPGLGVEWWERGVEMRLNIYLAADDTDWWVTEIATYNGRRDGDWIFYGGYWGRPFPGGQLPRTPLGETWSGDLDLTNGVAGFEKDPSEAKVVGELHIHGMRLSPGPG
jgi:hypothetical protein